MDEPRTAAVGLFVVDAAGEPGLVFCAYLPRRIHVAMCNELQGFVVLVAKSVREVFGG